MRQNLTLLLAAALTLALTTACGNDNGYIPVVDQVSEFGGITTDKKSPDADADADAGTPHCKVLWSKTLDNAGGTTHPAIGKQGAILVTAGQKLYSLGDAGSLKWVWPDHDPQGLVPPGGDLYTPVVGRESFLFIGSSSGGLISIDANGHGRYSVELEGTVSGAVAIASDADRIIILTDSGALYHFLDGIKHIKWEHTGEQKLANPLTGTQPIIGPASLFVEETILVLTADSLHAFDLTEGNLKWSFPMPAGHTPTSNGIMLLDGTVIFVTGEGEMGRYFSTSYVVMVSPAGPDGSETVAPLYENVTKVVSLSQGLHNTLLMGTDNAGLLAFDLATSQFHWQFVSQKQNFETVAQPAQGGDGFIYFSAARHWLQVATEYGEGLWDYELDPEVMGAILWPSSPLVLDDGTAIFKSGNYVYAVSCSDAGPAPLAWPRFGGNNKNSGNIADKLEPAE